jgi:hypothetical protein
VNHLEDDTVWECKCDCIEAENKPKGVLQDGSAQPKMGEEVVED